MAFIQIDPDAFTARYPLVRNHLNPVAGWTAGDGSGCLFETYGEELAFIRTVDPRRVWTLVDIDGGELAIMSGCHVVNRVGYLVSHDAVPVGTAIMVRLTTP